MVFAHNTEVALRAAADLVNSGNGLTDEAALEQFVVRWGWTGGRHRGPAELAAVRALSPRLRELWTADEDAVVAALNALLREAHALPQLVRHGEWGYHLHATSPDAPLADRMAVEAAMALLDVVRLRELARLRACAADSCPQVLVDLSKNRSRRFCGTACANRTNVAAFRARRLSQGSKR